MLELGDKPDMNADKTASTDASTVTVNKPGITNIVVDPDRSESVAFEGRCFGSVGQYEKIRGIAYGEIELKEAGGITRIISKGDPISSGTGLTPEAHKATALAKEDTMIFKIDQDILFNIMSKNSDITKIVIRNAVYLVENQKDLR